MPESIKSNNTKYNAQANVITFEEFFQYHLDPAVKRWRARKII